MIYSTKSFCILSGQDSLIMDFWIAKIEPYFHKSL
jgi:hypothetical protein